jgi:glycosyltransferase involved in cell wall biosynthesis
MRVLIASDTSSFMLGGVITETRHLLRGLAHAGHTVALVNDAPLAAGEVEHHKAESANAAAMAKAIELALTRFAPDVVHLLAMSTPGLARIAPLLTGHPWLFTCHSVSPYERKVPWFHGNETMHYTTRNLRYALNTIAWRWLFLSGRVPHVIGQSRFVMGLLARYGQDAAKQSLIHLGFDLPAQASTLSERPARRDKLRLLTIAGLAHTKGQHDAIAALPALCERFGKVEYRLIGEVRDPTYVAYLHKLAASLGVSQCLSITINVSEAEKLQALSSADVYVQPSHEEGFCLAYIEAAAVVPRLVGTDTGAIAAISADDEGARVVPVHSPKAIAAAVMDLLERPLPAGLMQQRVERLGRSFGWDSYIAAHEKLYRELIAAHPTSR